MMIKWVAEAGDNSDDKTKGTWSSIKKIVHLTIQLTQCLRNEVFH